MNLNRMASLLRSAELRKRLGISWRDFEALPVEDAEEWLAAWEAIKEQAERDHKEGSR